MSSEIWVTLRVIALRNVQQTCIPKRYEARREYHKAHRGATDNYELLAY